MDLHHFFAGGNSSKSPVTSSSSEQDEFSNIETLELDPLPKKHSSANISKSSQGKYNKKWEKDFLCLEYDHDYEGVFCKICRKHESQSLHNTGGVWTTKPFKNWMKAVEEMRAHSKSSSHIRNSESELLAAKR